MGSRDGVGNSVGRAGGRWRRCASAIVLETAASIKASRNRSIKIFVSERNLDKLDMRTGLYAGQMLIMFERTPAIAMASPALFLRRLGVTKDWNDALINFNQCHWFGGGNYWVIRLFRECPGTQRLAMAGHLAGAPKILAADALRSRGGRHVYVKFVNPTARAQAVTLHMRGGFPVRRATLRLVAPGRLLDKGSLADPHIIGIRTGTVRRAKKSRYKFTLPPWSAATLTLDK